MSLAPPSNTDLDRKDDVEMVETAKKHVEDGLIDPVGTETLVSNYAEASRGAVIRKFWRVFVIGILVASAGMYSGYTTSIPGSIVGNLGFIQTFGTVRDAKGNLALDANYVGLWNAINYVTQAVAQFGSPITAERFGIRFNMWTFTAFKLITIIIEIFSKNWWHFLLAKITNGLAAGLIGTSILSYASEVTMPQMRGTVLSSYAFFFSLGQLAVAIALDVINRTDPYGFRKAFYSQFVFLGLWIPVLVFLPESPVWLYKRGNTEKAKRARRRLIGNVADYDWDHEFAVFAQGVDSSAAAAAAQSKYSMLACFKGTNLRRTLVSTLPICCQNLVGVPLMFNAVYFFSLIGLKNTFTANLIIYCVLLAGVLVSFYLVDKVGRRPLLLGGTAFMSLCVFVVGGLGFMTLTDAAGNALVAIMSLWVAAYAISIAPIGWVSLVELSTPVLRTQTAGIAALMQSCVNVLFSYTVPLMLSNQGAGWGAKIGLFFGPLAAISCVAIYFFSPETKGRSFAEIDELFERRIPAWRFASTQTEAQAVAERDNVQRDGA